MRIRVLLSAVSCWLSAASAQWLPIASPGHDSDRLTHACVWDPVNDKIYMYGGTPNGNVGSNVTLLHRYDPVLNTWEQMADMNTPRGWIKGVYCQGRLYAFGGLNNSGGPLAECEAYDIATSTWSRIADLPYVNLAYAAVAWRDTYVYVLGGYGSGSGTSRVSVYIPSANAWSEADTLPRCMDMTDACIIGDTIWFAGGYDREGGARVVRMLKGGIDPLDPKHITWAWGPWLPETSSSLGPTVALNGKVYFWSRHRDSLSSYDLLRVFAPGTEAFDTFVRPPVHTTHGFFAVARDSTNEIYKIAGDDDGNWNPPNCSYYRIRVGEPQAVDERSTPPANRVPTPVTVVDGILRLPQASSIKPQASSYLLNIAGREVMKLQSGANDVSRLAPGIYFVREQLKPKHQAQAVRKVILTR